MPPRFRDLAQFLFADHVPRAHVLRPLTCTAEEGDWVKLLFSIYGYEKKNGHAQLEMVPRAAIILGGGSDVVSLKRKASGELELDDNGNLTMAAKRGSPTKSSPSKAATTSIWERAFGDNTMRAILGLHEEIVAQGRVQRAGADRTAVVHAEAFAQGIASVLEPAMLGDAHRCSSPSLEDELYSDVSDNSVTDLSSLDEQDVAKVHHEDYLVSTSVRLGAAMATAEIVRRNHRASKLTLRTTKSHRSPTATRSRAPTARTRCARGGHGSDLPDHARRPPANGRQPPQEPPAAPGGARRDRPR